VRAREPAGQAGRDPAGSRAAQRAGRPRGHRGRSTRHRAATRPGRVRQWSRAGVRPPFRNGRR
jgi:hypothetical protein